MEIQIGELDSQVDVLDAAALLSQPALRRIVEAVLAELDKRRSGDATLRADLDTRSIVEQQRGGRD